MNTEKIERNIAETAYFLLKYGYYGSQKKAITALRRRKDTKDCQRDFLEQSLSQAISMVNRTDDLMEEIIKGYSRTYHPQLTESEFNEGTKTLKDTLLSEYPDSEITIDYFIAMLWHM